MANTQVHILITGETGSARSYVIERLTIRRTLLCGGIALLVFAVGAVAAFGLISANQNLEEKISGLNHELQTTLGLKSAGIVSQQELASVLQEKEALLSRYQKEIAALKGEQQEKIEQSVSRLDQRTKIIESMMNTIGVKIKVEEDSGHSGGPFIPSSEGDGSEKLLARVDHYLKVLEATPFGRPLPTRISSRFGRRKDPLNKKKAFHQGLDFRGRTGDKIIATADGTVKRSTYAKGWGNLIVIRHGKGYETLFAHLNKRLVKRGEQIRRGQVIGRVGNTGRSTGSHLHYEIHLNGKPIDPFNYIKMAGLKKTVTQ
ncbi:M23 family metallopeptidase [Desulfogranum mediterraneum]|uniref:M23 family metallopeptidase n=1 Tax=Desulfogranum mediterraneum TaxID=160661 RepID=UPI000426F0D3|nr:M23 family metallopeptidase [Desulfogranum mediterraneum]